MTQPQKDKAPRSLKDALHEAIKKLPHDQQQNARKVLREKGVLQDHDRP